MVPEPACPSSASRMGTTQWVFLAGMVALDFAFGWVAKPLVQALGAGGLLKLEMVPPVMLILLTRLTLDRFGVLAAYEGAWGLACCVLMPGAILPGPLKLFPLVLQGLFLDAGFTAFRRWPAARIYLAAVLGGLAGSLATGGLRLALGLPWGRATQAWIAYQVLASMAVHAAGAALAAMAWARLRDHEALARIRVAG